MPLSNLVAREPWLEKRGNLVWRRLHWQLCIIQKMYQFLSTITSIILRKVIIINLLITHQLFNCQKNVFLTDKDQCMVVKLLFVVFSNSMKKVIPIISRIGYHPYLLMCKEIHLCGNIEFINKLRILC